MKHVHLRLGWLIELCGKLIYHEVILLYLVPMGFKENFWCKKRLIFQYN